MSSVRRIVLTVLSLSMASSPAAMAQFKLPGGEPTKKIAHFHLTGPIFERPQDEMLAFGGDTGTSLKELLERMKKARDDSSVRAAVVTLDSPAIGLAQIEELRRAMAQLRAVDKEVYVHADSLTNGAYALSCAASHVSLVPTGDLWLTGIYSEQPYLRGLLDKIDVVPQIIPIGDYKSAGEVFSRTGPSPEAEAMHNWLLDGIYGSIVSMIAESRQMPPEKVRALIDAGPYFADEALAAGLIDSVKHRQDFVAELEQRYGEDAQIVSGYGEDDEIDVGDMSSFTGLMKFWGELMSGGKEKASGTSIGLVYVEGLIVPGKSPQDMFGNTSGAGSTTIRRALTEAAEDDSVKAVVLRIESPGGSALASEIILDASKRVAAKKPLIISMGNVAGSGGYYVACGAHYIFADETTITGSIGVLGGKFVTTGMWDKLGVSWTDYQRGANSALMSSARPFTEEEAQRIRDYMVTVYDIFKGHVTANRGDKLPKPIEEIAGGRVYTGGQAIELGLVDRLGGMDEAVKYAASQARVGDYDLRVFPEPKTFMDVLMEAFGAGDDDDDRLSRVTASLGADGMFTRAVLPLLEGLDGVRVRAVLNTLKKAELLADEGVIVALPEEYVIR